MPSVTKKYSDIDLSFTPHPITGDITVLRDAEAVKRSLRNLISMNRFDRPFEPDLGTNLRNLLFEPINPLTEKSIDMQIRGAISRYEPRVSITDLTIEGRPDEHGYYITLKFVIDSLSIFETITAFLEKIR
jgi:phage baseplate assembly protein W